MTRTVGNRWALTVCATSFAIGVFGLVRNLSAQLPPHLKDAGHWQFLTNLLLAYSLVVFGVGVAAHLTKLAALFNLKNLLHPIGMALEFVVAVVYWPLRIFFINLLVEDPLKFKLPLLTDLCIHLMPVVLLFIDYLAFLPPWTLSTPTALTVMAVLTAGYWWWLKQLIAPGGTYPYNFLNVDTEQERVVVFVAVGTVAFMLFLATKALYGVFVRDTKLQMKKRI